MGQYEVMYKLEFRRMDFLGYISNNWDAFSAKGSTNNIISTMYAANWGKKFSCSE